MSEAPSVRESLQAALAGADPAPERVDTTPAAATTAEAAAPVTEAAAPTETAGQPRDATGKFAPKATDAVPTAESAAEQPPTAESKDQPETATSENKEPPKEAIRVPPSLPAAVKAKFADLDPDVQTAFAKLEDSVQTAKAEWGRKGERLNRYDEIIGPHLDKWRIAGLDEFSGVQTLIAAQNVLERNPVEGLLHIARSYGVDLRALAGQPSQQRPAAEGHGAPTVPSELQSMLQPLAQQVQTLQQQLQRQSQLSEQQKLAEAQAEVQSFAGDPKNLYFDNVREDVARRLDSGAAKTLQEAYDQAVWASPDIRQYLIAEQTKQAQAEDRKKAQEAAARTKAVSAQAAAGSIVGAPAPGAQAPKGPAGSIRDTLRAAMQEHGAA